MIEINFRDLIILFIGYVIGLFIGRIIDFIEKLLEKQKQESEKKWLELYGDLTKQFNELVEAREKLKKLLENTSHRFVNINGESKEVVEVDEVIGLIKNL